ncbi:MAG: radical SAM protein [Rhodobiaceae bacterium]|nr:radical SAM protein [Rhodobiaceae bacterium]MCC0014223.1 radical SAM protein [Rhodobiaceae bacterium]MCC0017779.1 radical SAM protein [Rhodobiaceae bacterium]MCC0061930.1 radical SAM protein [Rhodobiaceae bacterium]
MNDLDSERRLHAELLKPEKFRDPDVTASGAMRARVGLDRLDTLWINTGSLCNITCRNCYIESSPTNDRLVYITADEVRSFLDEIDVLKLGTREIGFTGGEPFMNPDIIAMLDDALSRGFEVLVLTNAMQPMMRPRLREGLLALKSKAGKLTLRISLDHYTQALHDDERGKGAFRRTIEGTNWLSENGFKLAVAGRTCWGETAQRAREGYRALFAEHGWQIDADDPAALVLFPEMDEALDIAEITTDCWGILNKSPSSVMCASSRMVVKRKGEDRPAVLPCTLLPYDKGFEMGATLSESLKADGGAFDNGKVKLNHPHCARFCVLGGASCSG